MAKDIDLNIRGLTQMLTDTPEQTYRGARRGLQDVLNEWQREARDDAPIKSGELRRQIKTKLDASNLEGNISNNVHEDGFNYAYWQHEVRGGDGLKYLDNVADENKDDWLRMIEKEIEIETKKAGW